MVTSATDTPALKEALHYEGSDDANFQRMVADLESCCRDNGWLTCPLRIRCEELYGIYCTHAGHAVTDDEFNDWKRKFDLAKEHSRVALDIN